MPTPSEFFSEMTASVLPTRRQGVADAVSNNNAYWTKLKSKNRIKTETGGTRIEERLMYDTFPIQNFQGASRWKLDGKQTMTASQWPWVDKVLTLVSTGREIRVAMGGEGQAVNFTRHRIEVAYKSIANHMAVEIYGDGLSTSSIYGLRALISDDGQGLIGGINANITPAWRNQYVRQDLAAFTPAQCYKDLTVLHLAIHNAGEKPDMVLANNDVYLAMDERLVANQRYHDVKLADAGFENMGFKGIPLVSDYNTNFGAGNAPRAYMPTLDTHYIFQHKDAKWQKDDARVPVDSDLVMIPFLAMMNAVCTNRRPNGVYTVN